MVSINRRIKIFNKIFKEFLIEYNKIYNKNFKIKVKNFEMLHKYNTDIEPRIDKFIKCDNSCLEHIELCKTIELKKIESNSKYIWSYLHNLYFITLEEKNEKLVEESKKSLKSLESLESLQILNKTKDIVPNIDFQNIAKNLQNSNLLNPNSDMGGLITDIASQVAKKLEGKDLSTINPLELITNMMSGNDSVGGIDFGSILKETSEKINNKVISGELDIEKLKSEAKSLLGDNHELSKEL